MLKETEKILIISAVFLLTARLTIGSMELINGIVSAQEFKVLQTGGQSQAEEIIGLTNQYRINLGLSQLTANPRLTQAAVNKANDILAKQYFSHTSPDGKRFSQWIKDSGYSYFYVGENLAIDFDNSQDLFDAWIKSEGHRKNIERPEFQEIGVASLHGKFKDRATDVVVQLFGARVMGASESSGHGDRQNDPGAPLSVDNYFSGKTGRGIGEPLEASKRYFDLMLIAYAPLLLGVMFINKKAGQPGSNVLIATKTAIATKQLPKPTPGDTKRRRKRNGDSNTSKEILPLTSRKSKPKRIRQPIIRLGQD